jgi:hypothetical protein
MSKLLTALQARLNGIRIVDIKPPVVGLNTEKEKILSVLKNDDLRRLFTLYVRLALELQSARKKVESKLGRTAVLNKLLRKLVDGKPHPSRCPSCWANTLNIVEILTCYEFAGRLLWAGVRSGLNKSQRAKLKKAGGGIGLRSGWKIVAISNEGKH